MSDRISLKGWCDWLRNDLAYRAPEDWPRQIEQWLTKTVRDYSPPDEQLVVIALWRRGEIRVYSLPEPMDRPTARKFLRDLKRTITEPDVQFHLRKINQIELRNPDEHRGPDPQ